MFFALALALIAVAYNNVINRWPPFQGAAYVPANLAFAATVTVVAVTALDLSTAELGLQGDLDDLVLSIVMLAVFGLGVFALAFSRHGHWIADKRVAGMRGAALGFYVLVRIPLGTALTEELIFRGVLVAAWLATGASQVAAATWSSVAFGLWHVTPTIIGLRINDPAASPTKVRAAVVVAVVATATAGAALTWLRVQTGGLVAPIVLHAGVNSFRGAGRHDGSATERSPSLELTDQRRGILRK